MQRSWIGVLAIGLCVGFGTMGATAASASVVDCSGIAGVGDAVAPNAGCNEILGVSNDDESVMNAAPGVFGITDWTFLGRDNWEPEIGDIDIFATGTALSGTFSFDASVTTGYSSVALVLKSAASANPCAVIAYRLQPGQTSGSYSSPFLCPQGNPQDISHITLYGSLVPAVPLPAGAVLLLTGVAGIGLLQRRRRAARQTRT